MLTKLFCLCGAARALPWALNFRDLQTLKVIKEKDARPFPLKLFQYMTDASPHLAGMLSTASLLVASAVLCSLVHYVISALQSESEDEPLCRARRALAII